MTSNRVGTRKSSKETTFSISVLDKLRLVSKNNLVVWINDVVAWNPKSLNLGSIIFLLFFENKIDGLFGSLRWALANSELSKYSKGICELIILGISIWLSV